jgi:hypothetical protein
VHHRVLVRLALQRRVLQQRPLRRGHRPQRVRHFERVGVALRRLLAWMHLRRGVSSGDERRGVRVYELPPDRRVVFDLD